MLKICFTGHRPNKLGGYNWSTPKNQLIMKELKHTIEDVMHNSNEKQFYFIFGGALGIDQMAFDVVENIVSNSELDSICFTMELAMPFEKQDNNWLQESKNELLRERKMANIVTLVDTLDKYKIKGYVVGEYYPAKMQKRNEYMVDNADIIIAVWDGTKGGTANCINYAKKLDKKIVQINPNDLK